MPRPTSATSTSTKPRAANAPRDRKPVIVSAKHSLAADGTEMDYRRIWRAGAVERIQMMKAGISAIQAKQIIADLHLPITKAGVLGDVPISTLNRKVKKQELLTPSVSERFLGLAKLIGQVQTMVEESGDPDGFDAKAWTASWLNAPLPAFGGLPPIEMMDTMEGQALVSTTLAMMQSGAYA